MRISIFGCCGAGKTYLANALHDLTGIPVVHLDNLYWKDNWEHVPEELFLFRLNNELRRNEWIIEGLYSRCLYERLNASDIIIYMDYSSLACFLTVLKRELKYLGKPRPGMLYKCDERLDFGFLLCILKYNSQNRRNNYLMLKKFENKKVIVIRNKRQCNAFIRSIRNKSTLMKD